MMAITHSANHRRHFKRLFLLCRLYVTTLIALCAIMILGTLLVISPGLKELKEDVWPEVSDGAFPDNLIKRGPGGGYLLQTRRGRKGPPLQLEHLRSFCSKYAPGLENAWWKRKNIVNFPIRSNKSKDIRLPPYPIFPGPVCFLGGSSYFDGDDLDRRRNLGGARVKLFPSWRRLTDNVLMDMQNNSYIRSLTFVPAIAIVFLNGFSLGQMYHVLNDMVKEVMVIMTEVGNETTLWKYSELGKSPTQFFALPRAELLWTRENLASALPQTTHFLGAFSHPTAPTRYFFNDIPVLSRDAVYCTCQAMFTCEVPPDETFEQKTVAFRLIGDLMVRYMNETPHESAQEVSDDLEKKQVVPLSILRRFSHVPQIAKRFWETELKVMAKYKSREPGDKTQEPFVYRPRLLLINRNFREIHDYQAVAALAERVGFNVQVVYFEKMPLEDQVHVSRHADVMMGMHGMGLTHVLWMDGRRRPRCRALLELMPFGCPRTLIHFYKLFADTVGIHYEYIEAADMYLKDMGGLHKSKAQQRDLEAVKAVMRACKFDYMYRGFTNQVAIYNMSVLEQRLVAALQRLKQCGVA
ncbi:hypothetical protein C3747_11g86 [Trypanosoma cruzi]|uniref:Glycosyltransferase 61 catalytic domain-containing protein n=2 Tax=Trypanosoma cruzi TaxID=5693 RepID=Q4DA11_TRYCC|nr:hypothetical protein, conserved [Trypanosoma cruzi]EAN89358.1 hypothetical protein, conserved [Trypanosoma cruzi]PWV18977.1 hypothetical protein C3747_11g86 [Trypanosoma cruzi]RNC59425.1 glycosyltransferase [Trypanosoma cruzi]|eukprot:XP_811209.1 hypothetical protein [Trypanosoma cruzi strain CL Brener]